VGATLSHPGPASGALLRGPASQLASSWPCPSAMPSTSTPARGPVRGAITSFAGNSIRRNGNDASSSADGTASCAGQWMVNEDGVICLSDDNE
jgi:hypothetical protein